MPLMNKTWLDTNCSRNKLLKQYLGSFCRKRSFLLHDVFIKADIFYIYQSYNERKH